MTSTSQRLSFKLHPQILISTIEDQATGFPKALAELVMNSVDAGATQVDIELEGRFFKVIDNGKGFNKKQVMEYFRTFGAPHEDGDAYYGKFRIGRGQIMCYAETLWQSGKYQMAVDIYAPLRTKKFKDLAFDFTTVTGQPWAGCFIQGDIYEDMFESDAQFEVDYVSRELYELLKYVPVPVTFNRRLINTPNFEELATFEDEFAYYILDAKRRDLQLFNRGVLVENARFNNTLLYGDIITKKSLQLTTSRNDVLTDRCPVWQGIIQSIATKYEMDFITKTSKITDVEVKTILINTLTRDVEYPLELIQSVLDYKFIPNQNDQKISFRQLANYDRFTMFDVDTSPSSIVFAERIAQRDPNCFVCNDNSPAFGNLTFTTYSHYRILNNDNVWTMEAFFKLLNPFLTKHLGRPVNLEYYWFDDAMEDHKDDKKTFEEETLDAFQLEILGALKQINLQLHADLKLDGEPRTIQLGSSEMSEAWTNGASYIAFDWANTLQIFQNKAVSKLIGIFVHEYCHGNEDPSHGFEFYKKFHDLTIDADMMNLHLTIASCFNKFGELKNA